ncbi:MAG: oligosaccharide flippase family protein [Candidatus Spechtbacterales bacterium]|nr:oligosaccharide flippase family protein [Candidatus Spechtbacterales bacterium]
MRGKIKSLWANRVIRGGSALYIGGILVNVFNYFYRVAMGRMMSPADFGEVIALISLIMILTVPSTPLHSAGVRFTSEFKAKGQLSKIKSLIVRLTGFVTLIVSVFAVLAIILAEPLQQFLSISSLPVFYVFVISIALLTISSVNRGVLPGLERFKKTAAMITVEGAVKFFAAVLLVSAGFQIVGALSAVVISVAILIAMSFYYLKDILKVKGDGHFSVDSKVLAYMFFAFLSFLFLNIILNSDVILVKRYFSADDAGLYSAISTVGRIVFIAGTALGGIMFPIVRRKKDTGENYFKPFAITVALILAITILASAFLFLFPEFTMQLLFGGKYLEGASILGYYGVAMGLIAVIFISSSFFLAVDKFSYLYGLFAASMLQLVLIKFWHASFLDVIRALFISISLYLLWALILTLTQYKREIENIRVNKIAT